jgi:hypothetical protein
VLCLQRRLDWKEVDGHKIEIVTMSVGGNKMTGAWRSCFESCGEDPMMGGDDAREGGRTNGCEQPLDWLRSMPQRTYRASSQTEKYGAFPFATKIDVYRGKQYWPLFAKSNGRNEDQPAVEERTTRP